MQPTMRWAISVARYAQGELPTLTEARKAQLKTLAARPDSEIDYNDIPPLNDQFRNRAGYLTRLNPILRRGMLEDLQHKA